MKILAVNAGSSSLRVGIFVLHGDQLVSVSNAHYRISPAQQEEKLQEFLEVDGSEIGLVAHRLVHGGNLISGATILDREVEADIERLAPLAPLHNPAALTLIRLCSEFLGEEVVQVVVPDTAFYADLPDVASRYAIPSELSERFRIRRYGFHGLAHKAMLQRWHAMQPDRAEQSRVISLQLGAGCSITASRGSRAVDTSMGFTPLEGLVMATRSGDVDAGVLLYLQREAGYSGADLDRLLNYESGLLGMSAISGDMRELLTSEKPAAKLAIDSYCYRARKYVGAYLAVLGGADAILFGGGVGENSSIVREKILSGMEGFGIVLDTRANREIEEKEAKISRVTGSTEIWVMRVDESTCLIQEALRAAHDRTDK